MTDRTCPLGEDCDLTVAWMAGAEDQRKHMRRRLAEAAARIEALEAALAEMTRRRDEWRKKAEGYDAVRLALREKVGSPWPPHMSRLLWAGIAADEKKRADDAEAALLAADGCANWCDALIEIVHKTSCEPDDPEEFDEVLMGAQLFLAAYRRATGGGT